LRVGCFGRLLGVTCRHVGDNSKAPALPPTVLMRVGYSTLGILGEISPNKPSTIFFIRMSKEDSFFMGVPELSVIEHIFYGKL